MSEAPRPGAGAARPRGDAGTGDPPEVSARDRAGGVAAAVEARVRAGGLLAGPVVVLLSGGRDSTCLLDLAVRLAGPVTALHLNYGLRDAAAADQAQCEATCARLGVELIVQRPRRPPQGNVQAWARDERYAHASRLAPARDAVVAAGHTATDQIETVLYRLAASPGRRALLGMPERSGRLVRPLLGITREETAAYCAERGLAWREDASNEESKRGRMRAGLVPALRALHPAAEENILRTLALLREEAAVLDAAVDVALGEGPPEIARLAAMPPALARLAIQRLADRAAGGETPPAGGGDPVVEDVPAPGPAVGDRLDEILALGDRGTRSLDLPGGLRAVVTYGRLTIERARAPAQPLPARLTVPGSAAFGGGVIAAERGADIPVADGTLDARPLAAELEVRAWRPGDRMRPLGLAGSRSLQDLFTDRKVPREQRSRIPVVVSAGEIAWVPGVATAERFRVTDATTDRVRLSWESPA
ncbi:tRNA lysidine(34) synthetase TilS [Candidatus Solirubrobacter pratensis]|uniref:tRNA lysidine(34) synthetase TilS n=1 Tax=Candidatus Solirubrobacter pratensis TaxID=1298857 RepID=UPI0003FBB594|nr:tRNA lysidine(34) synthetase TilS [Candidatus Solirubrobacter pratensis]